MRKLLIVCGPTATGKTDLGILLARKFNGEIVSADSRQVYREMDILTGKDIPENSKFKKQNAKLNIPNSNFAAGYRMKENIPVWLLDIVPPDYDFNISDYSSLAKAVINNIRGRDKLPVVVGGAGFYINSLFDKYETVTIPRNERLRKELSLFDTGKLQQRLKNLDRKKIDSMNNSDINNPRRLVRAIEVASWENNHSSLKKTDIPLASDSVLMIGLTASREIILKNIEKRVHRRIKKGAVEEVKKIREKYKNTSMISSAATGFRELSAFLNGESKLEDSLKLWIRREQQYANRQTVWFKKMKDIVWFDTGDREFASQIEERVGKWYTSSSS